MKTAIRIRCRKGENVIAALSREMRELADRGDAATVRWLRGEASDADLATITKAERAAAWLVSGGDGR